MEPTLESMLYLCFITKKPVLNIYDKSKEISHRMSYHILLQFVFGVYFYNIISYQESKQWQIEAKKMQSKYENALLDNYTVLLLKREQ